MMRTADVPARPLALLDVEGVLLPWRPRRGRPPRVTRLRAGRRLGELNPEHRRWLAQLARQFELAWATSWGEVAAEIIGPGLGLPASIPVVELMATGRKRTGKLADVARFVGDRPCAWVDDHFGRDAFEWAHDRSAPTLLLATDPSIGLEHRHVERLLLFAAAVRGAWADRTDAD
jgi:hypothetical protein